MRDFVALRATIIAASVTACAVSYQPLLGNTGYTAEVLEGGRVRIEYRGPSTATYKVLERALDTYASELCPGQGRPTQIERDVFTPTVWSGPRRPDQTRSVSAVIDCPQPVQSVLEQSSISVY